MVIAGSQLGGQVRNPEQGISQHEAYASLVGSRIDSKEGQGKTKGIEI